MGREFVGMALYGTLLSPHGEVGHVSKQVYMHETLFRPDFKKRIVLSFLQNK